MPIYEYRCRHCGHNFETIVRSTQETVSCPKCRSSVVKKQLSVFSAPGARSAHAPSSGGGCSCTPQTCGCH